MSAVLKYKNAKSNNYHQKVSK